MVYQIGGETVKNKIKFKIMEFLYRHKLFGVHKKCWADLVISTKLAGKWRDIQDATKCGYCCACMTKEEREEYLRRKFNVYDTQKRLR